MVLQGDGGGGWRHLFAEDRNQKEIKKKSRTFGSSAGMVVKRRKLEARRCETVHTQAAVRYISHLIITAAYGAMTAGDEF